MYLSLSTGGSARSGTAGGKLSGWENGLRCRGATERNIKMEMKAAAAAAITGLRLTEKDYLNDSKEARHLKRLMGFKVQWEKNVEGRMQ